MDDFLPLGLLLEAHYDVFENKKLLIEMATFLFNPLTQISSFKNYLLLILAGLKWFDVHVLDFQFEHICVYISNGQTFFHYSGFPDCMSGIRNTSFS